MIKIFKLDKDETIRNLYKKCNNLGMNPSYCKLMETVWNELYVADSDEIKDDELVDIISIAENPRCSIEDFKGDNFYIDVDFIIRYGDNDIIDIYMNDEHFRFYNTDVNINTIAPLLNFEKMNEHLGITKELGNVIDEWSNAYEYEFRYYNNEIIRFDLQTKMIDKVDINYLVEFYKEQIEYKILQDYDIEELFQNDLDILNSFLNK